MYVKAMKYSPEKRKGLTSDPRNGMMALGQSQTYFQLLSACFFQTVWKTP